MVLLTLSIASKISNLLFILLGIPCIYWFHVKHTLLSPANAAGPGRGAVETRSSRPGTGVERFDELSSRRGSASRSSAPFDRKARHGHRAIRAVRAHRLPLRARISKAKASASETDAPGKIGVMDDAGDERQRNCVGLVRMSNESFAAGRHSEVVTPSPCSCLCGHKARPTPFEIVPPSHRSPR